MARRQDLRLRPFSRAKNSSTPWWRKGINGRRCPSASAWLGSVGPSPAQMTKAWKSYRYMRKNPDLRSGIAKMEARVASEPLYYIPKSQVSGIESRLQSGDIIGICSHDGGLIGTSHVGLAYRGSDGVLHFMHASAPHNYGKVVVDQRLSDYLYHFRTDAGILVARPLR